MKTASRLLVFCLLSGCTSDSGGSSSSGAGSIALPAGWAAKDVGTPAFPGASSHAGGVYTLCGSGADIWGTSDAFQFAYVPLRGDGEITARVLSLDFSDAWAKAGVMIRDSLAADAKFAMTIVTPVNGAQLQFRESTGGHAGLLSGLPLAAPAWVRLSRAGNVFRAALSGDGLSWQDAGGRTIEMGADVLAGLCLTSHTDATTACATFDSLSVSGGGGAWMSVSAPVSRIVYQRNNANGAVVRIAGNCGGVGRVEARLVALQGGTSTSWTTIDDDTPGAFEGTLAGTGGWYRLELRGLAGASVVATASVARVGIGEVFVVSGHSVAHGDSFSIAGASDDRATTVHFPESAAYLDTADPRWLPVPGFVHFGNDVRPAPFGYSPHLWARFAERLAQRANVPVLLYNAAFGGTSLEHWAKSSRGEWFEHGFVKASIGMPYVNVRNALRTYIPLTGIRAILSDHGQNDWGSTNEDQVVADYLAWIGQARTDMGHGALAVVVNRATPFMTVPLIRRAQERVAASPHCFAGPDYDTLAPEHRYDGTHLSLSGQERAAELWADAVSDGFLASSQPWLP